MALKVLCASKKKWHSSLNGFLHFPTKEKKTIFCITTSAQLYPYMSPTTFVFEKYHRAQYLLCLNWSENRAHLAHLFVCPIPNFLTLLQQNMFLFVEYCCQKKGVFQCSFGWNFFHFLTSISSWVSHAVHKCLQYMYLSTIFYNCEMSLSQMQSCWRHILI